MNLMSEQIDQLATALAKAQGEMMTAGKNQKNPFFKSSYADFEAIINASRPALSKYGLSVVQSISEDESGFTCLFSILMHSSGQWIKSKAKLNPAKTDVQSLASYNTYLKRMCYTSLVGVAVGDDDDGEAAVDRANTQSNSQFKQTFNCSRPSIDSSVDLVTEEELSYLGRLNRDTQNGILEKYEVKALRDLNRKQFAVIEERIENAKKKMLDNETKGA